MTEHKIPIPSMIYNASVGGHVTNSQQIIDDVLNKEQSVINVEQQELNKGILEEKEYTSGSNNGMGRVVLRKNIVKGVNTLTQSMINKSNTIYVIQYDFTLGENITIPDNCVLEFDGGSVSGNYILTFTDTFIKESEKAISCLIGGTITNKELHIDSFDIISNTNQIDGAKLNNILSIAFNSNCKFVFKEGTYTCSQNLYFQDSGIINVKGIHIDGRNCVFSGFVFNIGKPQNNKVDNYIYDKGIIIENLIFNTAILKIYDCSNVIIKNCKFYDFTVEGLNIQSSGSNFTIENCYFEDPYNIANPNTPRESKGIQLICYPDDYSNICFHSDTYEVTDTSTGLILSNFKIINCTFNATRVQLNNVKDGIISNNYWTGPGVRCVNISPKGDNVNITNNTIEGFEGSTIFNVNHNSNNVLIANNTIRNCQTAYGIHVASGALDVVIKDNIIKDIATFSTISLDALVSGVVENNYISSLNITKGGGTWGEITYRVATLNNAASGQNVTNPNLPPIIIRNNTIEGKFNGIYIDGNENDGGTVLHAQVILDNNVVYKNTNNSTYCVRLSAIKSSDIIVYENNPQIYNRYTSLKFEGNIKFAQKTIYEYKEKIQIENGVVTRTPLGGNKGCYYSEAPTGSQFLVRGEYNNNRDSLYVSFIKDIEIIKGVEFIRVEYIDKVFDLVSYCVYGGRAIYGTERTGIEFIITWGGEKAEDGKPKVFYLNRNKIAPKNGSTRPSGVSVGFQFFDEKLNPPRPIWKTYSGWVDATGATV